jgi:uncharacterized membrane protein (UPF0127 family)
MTRTRANAGMPVPGFPIPGNGVFLLPVLLFALVLGACDEAAGTPLVVIARQTADAVAEADGLDRIDATVGEVGLTLEVATAPEDRQLGLSGRSGLDPDAGMLFHFPSGSATGLWMNEMRFDLDFIWVGADCTVVDLHEYVPAPVGLDDALPIYRPDVAAATVIELAAGSVAADGIKLGDTVGFGPSQSGVTYGCDGP